MRRHKSASPTFLSGRGREAATVLSARVDRTPVPSLGDIVSGAPSSVGPSSVCSGCA